MDPLTCLSVVSNATQLTDFMFHLLRESWRIHRSGAGCADSTKSIEGITANLIKLNDRVANAIQERMACENASSDESSRRTESSESILSTARACSATATQLIGVLEKLKTSNTGFWDSLQVALRTAMRKEEVKSLCSVVFHLQCSLAAHLQFELL